jgi:hypothetical protein
MGLVRELTNRWRPDLQLPSDWLSAKSAIIKQLGALGRFLNIIQGAVEYPQSMWKPRIQCTTNTNLTVTAAVDITGATLTFTPDVDMTVFCQAAFDVQCTLFGSTGHAFFGWLVVNGVQQSPIFVSGFSALNDRRNLCRSWLVPLKSGAVTTIKLQGATSNVGSNYIAYASQTDLLIGTFPNPYQVP